MQYRNRPKLPRKPIVLAVAICFLVSALLIPNAVHFPRWVETEMVLAAWWGVWVAALAWILYEGHAVDDDVDLPKLSEGRSASLLDIIGYTINLGGCAPAEGCMWAIVAVLGTLLLGLAVFVLIEFVLPMIAMLLLVSIGGMVARAVNDTHGCEGRWFPSLLWGALWATVYTGPIAAIVVWTSALIAHRP